MMNRAQRRNLKATVKRMVKGGGLKHPIPGSVVLHGGPMDGWIVKQEAAVLQEDWHTTWPPSVEAKHRPGHYELRGNGQAEWVVEE